MSLRHGKLYCDMRDGCLNPVTHIGERGWAYCATHAPWRRGYERTRRLLVSERKQLERGEPLASFERSKR